MAIQIGKYKRPGIFIEEYDKSIINTPIIPDDRNSAMVIGFSKKGPFNSAILLKNLADLESIYGSIDRYLERKGNYFHRTIAKLLESGPVYALNLLLTDDTLDTVEYIQLSAATDKTNDSKRTGAYRRFFDTTGFWKRDTDRFIDITDDNSGYTDRVLNLTNLSDRYITVFIFKSKATGFDRTLIEWYGSVEKMPTYLNATEYASDYMVDVLVVGGDWSDYNELSVDVRWSSYFDTTGLKKDQIYNFGNDRNVTLLGFYEAVSLIPYFRDLDGRDIFIESVINRETNKTGLFCAFNYDLFETDYPNGLVDLIGNNLVGEEISSINFLSYYDTIIEAVSYNATYLDMPGNVSGMGTSSHNFRDNTTYGTYSEFRTGYYAEGTIGGVTFSGVTGTTSSQITFTYVADAADLLGTYSTSAYGIIGGSFVPITTGTHSITMSVTDYLTSGTYSSAIVLDSTGTIKAVNNLLTSATPSVATTDIVLNSAQIVVGTQSAFTTVSVTDFSLTTGGMFKDLAYGTDFTISNVGTTASASLKVEFPGTAVSPNVSNYAVYRRFKMFNYLVSILDSANKNKVSMVIDFETGEKRNLGTMTVSNIVTATTGVKSFVLNTNIEEYLLQDVLDGTFLLYTIDNELLLGTQGMLTKNTLQSTEEGVSALYSDFYIDYVAGSINTGDYFYNNFVSGTGSVTFGTNSVTFNSFGTTNWPATASVGDQFIVPSATLNTGVYTIAGTASGTPPEYTYEITEDVVAETLSSVNMIYDYNNKIYLRMYLDSSNNLHTTFFSDSALTTTASIPTSTNKTFKVQSGDSNYKQTVEIEIPSGYTEVSNKILVNGARYSEIKVGDFLEAYVATASLVSGQESKKLTRILNKRQYADDTSLTEITCDARIKKTPYGTDYQTTRYTTIEDYISTYKAITLKGFRFRAASLPDGTETKQNAILNLVATGTPLYKALINKDAINFRYLVDSWGLGLSEYSKQQLVDICGGRLDCIGFINMPSFKDFKNSASPSFLDSDGYVSFEYVSKGGDPESNPAFLYSFANGSGVTSVGYFTPYLTINDNGRMLDVPPAPYVATTYLRKHNSTVTSITPWTVSAGVTNGRITGINGIEIDIPPEGIDWLNSAQMNAIVFKRNRGYVIESENTAQTLYLSALSYLHVREVLIELEKELTNMLLDFQWKVNTPEVRSEIKLKADIICEQYVNMKGLYNYFNKCDEENNTLDLIDRQIGVLDTYVEPIKSMGIIVNNITILRTGAIQAGGFMI